MAKKTAMEPGRRTAVITVGDHHDERDFLDTIYEITETGTAHVRYVSRMAEGLEHTFAVSNYPISTRHALKAVHEREIEDARNDLRITKDPYEVLNCYRLLAGDIDRIAKEEGITLPENWFQIGEQEAGAACARAAHAEVARLEGLLAKVGSDLATARTRAQKGTGDHIGSAKRPQSEP